MNTETKDAWQDLGFCSANSRGTEKIGSTNRGKPKSCPPGSGGASGGTYKNTSPNIGGRFNAPPGSGRSISRRHSWVLVSRWGEQQKHVCRRCNASRIRSMADARTAVKYVSADGVRFGSAPACRP